MIENDYNGKGRYMMMMMMMMMMMIGRRWSNGLGRQIGKRTGLKRVNISRYF